MRTSFTVTLNEATAKREDTKKRRSEGVVRVPPPPAYGFYLCAFFVSSILRFFDVKPWVRLSSTVEAAG